MLREMKVQILYKPQLKQWSFRLEVRTSPFHGEDGGSNPSETANTLPFNTLILG